MGVTHQFRCVDDQRAYHLSRILLFLSNDSPSLNALVLITIQDGCVNGANLHLLTVLSTGGSINAMLLYEVVFSPVSPRMHSLQTEISNLNKNIEA